MTTSNFTKRFLCALCVVLATANAAFLFGQEQRSRFVDPSSPSGVVTRTGTDASAPNSSVVVGSAGAGVSSTTPPTANDAVSGSSATPNVNGASTTSASPASTLPSSEQDAEEPLAERSAQEEQRPFPGYRYWMAPDSSIDRWPWGTRKYLPISSTDFDDWLAITQRRALLQDYIDGLRFPGVVSTLRLSATLVDDALVGDAALETLAFPIDESDGASFTTPPLASFSVAASYPDSDSRTLVEEFATYPDGGFYLPDVEEKTRRFEWSKRGTVEAPGELGYEFDFQSILRAEMTIETSSTDLVMATGGVVLPIASDDERDVRTWRVCFRGRSHAKLTIIRETSEMDGESPVRAIGYRQETSYRISLSGIEVSSRFEFERAPSDFAETTITLDPRLEFLTLEWGTTPMRPISVTRDADGKTRVRTRIPATIVGETPNVLRVTAFRNMWFGSSTLPTIQLESSTLAWYETLLRLVIASPLTVSSIEPINAVQARDVNRSRAEGASYLTFKLFEPGGAVRFTLRHMVSPPSFDSATDCYFAANEISAKTTLFLNFDGVARNSVTIPLSPGWDVDSVQAATPDSVSWSRELVDVDRRTLRLSFKTPPPQDQPTRVTIAAQYVAPIEERTPVDRLCPLELQTSLVGAHALSVRSDASSQIRYTTSAGAPLAPVETSPRFVFGESLLREATPLAPGGVRLWLGDQTVDAFASLENVRSSYSVELSCCCELGEEKFKESWRLHCIPSSGMRVDEIVFFANPSIEVEDSPQGRSSGQKWTWSTAVEPDRFFEATKLSREEAAALHAPDGCDAYEIRLGTSRSMPFDLNVFCEVPATSRIQAPLIFFPDSAVQTVEVVVDASPETRVKTEGRGIAESTVPTSGASDPRFLRKAFRYDPTAVFGASAELERLVAAREDLDPSETEDGETVDSGAARTSSPGALVAPRLELINVRRPHERNEEETFLSSLCWFENYDSYYQTNGIHRHCATFYIENRGRDSIRILLTLPPNNDEKASDFDEDWYLPDSLRDEANANRDVFFTGALAGYESWQYVGHGDVFDSIDAVWADGERTSWTLWRYSTKEDEPRRYVLDVRLFAKKRYTRVELDYCERSKGRLGGSRRVKPIEISCDAPVLSGVWNAWFPPHFQTRRPYFLENEEGVGIGRWFYAVADSLFLARRDREEFEEIARRVASRLGDEFALRLAISEARRADSRKLQREKASENSENNALEQGAQTTVNPTSARQNGSAPKSENLELDALRLDAPTWGDVFGSPSMVSTLFAPGSEEDAKDLKELDESEEFVVDSAFGKLEGVRRPIKLFLDRYALVTVGVSPDQPLPTVEERNPIERANRLLEVAGMKLLLVTPELALVTTSEALSRQYSDEFISPLIPSICSPSSRSAARRIRDDILNPHSRRYIEPALWRGLVESTSPWTATGFDASDGSAVRGWSFTSIPLDRAGEGVYIVNRYMLVGLEFFGFIAFLVVFWRHSLMKPRFLIATIGICLALLFPARYELASLVRGIFYAAICLFLCRSIRVFAPVQKSKKEEEPSDDESFSSEGRVDFAQLSPEEYRYIQTGVVDRPPSEPFTSVEGDFPGREGRASTTALMALAAILVILFATASLAQSPNGAPVPPVTPGDLATTSEPSVAPDAQEEDPYQEPHRVFVPIDDERRHSGEYYWVDTEFYKIIRSDLRDPPRERSWRIVDALYQGIVNYNSFSETTSIFGLRATYTVILDEPTATLELPAVQLVSEGGARFDKQTTTFSYSEDGSRIFFDIQSEPGVHTFELSLVAPQFFETTSRLSIPIIPVPSARLELDVSIDAPLLDAPGALGRIKRSPRRFSAELGPIDRLVVTKAETSERFQRAEVDVEQYFLMRPRATQTDVRAMFRCQTIGGKIQALEIECDPAFSFSGYCKCDAGEIESVDSPTATNPAMRVSFKKPISGAFTLNVDFVARNFSGVGRLPIPRVSTRDARILKNWLAIAPEAGVECFSAPSEAGLATAFQAAWGPLESKIVAAYDLQTIDRSALVDVRLARTEALTTETTTCVFMPAFTELTYNAALETDSDVFRLQIDVPKPFVVDSVAVTDENGAGVSGITQTLAEDGLCLDFETPLRGKRLISVVGRTRRVIGRDAPFPILAIRDTSRQRRFVRVFCAPNVDLDWKTFPPNWIAVASDDLANVEDVPVDAPQDVSYVECYEIRELVGRDDASTSQSADSEQGTLATANDEVSENVATPPEPVVAVRINVPTIEGLERIFLYPSSSPVSRAQSGELWTAAYQFRFKVTKGRLDRLYVTADDSFALEPLPSNSIFTATETTTSSGVKAILFEPRHALEEDDREVELLFTASFKNDPSGARLPRFRATQSSLYENLSEVERVAFLPTFYAGSPIMWTTRDLRVEEDPILERDRERHELLKGMNRGSRAMAISGASSADADFVGATTPFPAVVELAQRNVSLVFEKYARGEDAFAKLASQRDSLKVELARYSFFVNERREIFGGAIFMIEPGANDSCIVAAPPGYHILEARVNGARMLVERAPDHDPAEEAEDEDADANEADNANDADDSYEFDASDAPERDGETRWLVELGATPYVKRLEIAFQASGAASATSTLFKTLRRQGERFSLDFLRLETANSARRPASIERTLWACAFEDFDSEKGEARWIVSQISSVDADADASSDSEIVSRECFPALVDQAGVAMRRVGLEDAFALLNAYEEDAATLSGARSDDLERMKARWFAAWREVVGATSPYVADPRNNTLMLQSALARSIVVVNNGVFLPVEEVDSNFPVPDWSPSRVGEIESARERVFESSGLDPRALREGGVSSASAQSLWTLHSGSRAKALFGSTNARIAQIEIVAKPKTFDFLASPYAAAVFLLMATAAILQLFDPGYRSRRLVTVAHLSLMLIWAICFFFFGWTFVALVGVFMLGFLPFVWGAVASSRRAQPESETVVSSAAEEEEAPSDHVFHSGSTTKSLDYQSFDDSDGDY
ncbi:MAG: hypothetical protein ACOX0A_10850 [Thermoguttaceae bacterium]